MALDLTGIVGRLRAVLPQGWFADDAPVLNAVLESLAAPWMWLFQLLDYSKAQTRICTATDSWLDLIANDFLGSAVTRQSNEGDAAFRSRIQSNLFAGAATRPALIDSVARLTGADVVIFEPFNPSDTGAYGWPGGNQPQGLGYGIAGGWGSLNMPWQFFMTVTLPSTEEAFLSGYGNMAGGYGQGSIAYTSAANIAGQVSEREVAASIARLAPVNATVWLRVF